jgi:hypothetical protein
MFEESGVAFLCAEGLCSHSVGNSGEKSYNYEFCGAAFKTRW